MFCLIVNKLNKLKMIIKLAHMIYFRAVKINNVYVIHSFMHVCMYIYIYISV